MASIIPIAVTAVQAFQTIGAVAEVFDDSRQQASSNDLALRQLQQQQALQEQQAVQNANLSKQELAIKAETAESERKAALKRAMARQRAAFGASGVSTSGGGSTEAVLLGLFDESEEEKESREKLDRIRVQAIDQNLSQSKRVNTLKRTQEKQKQKLQKSSSTLDTFNNLLSVF